MRAREKPQGRKSTRTRERGPVTRDSGGHLKLPYSLIVAACAVRHYDVATARSTGVSRHLICLADSIDLFV